jgi:hypothetical protein
MYLFQSQICKKTTASQKQAVASTSDFKEFGVSQQALINDPTGIARRQ